MSDAFSSRGKAEERKFAHDSETQFKLQAKAVRRTATWAFEKCPNLTNDPEQYGRDLVVNHLVTGGFAAVATFLSVELAKHDVAYTNDQVLIKLQDALALLQAEYKNDR